MDPDCIDSFNLSIDEIPSMIYGPGHTFYITAFLPLLMVIGVLGNLAFIYVVIKIPRMRTCTNCYLLNLAISDIIFLLMAIGEKIWRYAMSPILDDDNPMGRGGCIWVFLLSDAAYIASLFFITFVSVERYCAVCRPQKKSETSQFTKTAVFTSASWIISAIVAAALTPSNFMFNKYCLQWPPGQQFADYPTTFALCHPLHDWIAAYALGMQTIPFFISLVVNILLYIAIIRGLNRSIERLRIHGGTKDNDTKMRDQVARMLVINGAFFFCSLAPFEFVSALNMVARMSGENYFGSATAKEVLSYVGRSLSYINAVINPIIYTVMSNRYREAFKQAFHIGMSRSSKRLISGKSTTQATTQEYLKVNQDTRM
ncbi:neuropeptides capa receptor-like [Diadema setosum]|uniref:neuropeptides capa receptor-like n=1 Tax=Diadema setosum TaxID=31175 RepID=UPI003B3BCAE3